MDYVPSDGTVVFQPGGDTDDCIDIGIIDDGDSRVQLERTMFHQMALSHSSQAVTLMTVLTLVSLTMVILVCSWSGLCSI